MLSLSSAVRVADFDSLELVLDGPDCVLECVVFHLDLEHSNNILNSRVILHGHVRAGPGPWGGGGEVF